MANRTNGISTNAISTLGYLCLKGQAKNILMQNMASNLNKTKRRIKNSNFIWVFSRQRSFFEEKLTQKKGWFSKLNHHLICIWSLSFLQVPLLVRGEKTTLFGYAWLWTGVLITPNIRLRSRLYLRKTTQCWCRASSEVCIYRQRGSNFQKLLE